MGKKISTLEIATQFSHKYIIYLPTYAGIVLLAPLGSTKLSFTILSKTEGGPAVADDSATADESARVAILF